MSGIRDEAGEGSEPSSPAASGLAPATPVAWPAPSGVRAWQTQRGGGVSGPPWRSFNLGSHVGDDPAAVTRNRQLLREILALPAEPVWLRQVHGTAVVDLDAHPPGAAAPVADAAVATTPGQVCAVLTADCLPVLLCDRAAGVVAAAHAGWRGLADGVLAAAVSAMERPPGQLLAWLGPAICERAFEVGADVRERFLDVRPQDEDAFRRNARGRWQADLVLLAERRLHALGVAQVTRAGACTWHQRAQYFSHRRDGNCGRMASLIWLAGPGRGDDGGPLRSRGC